MKVRARPVNTCRHVSAADAGAEAVSQRESVARLIPGSRGRATWHTRPPAMVMTMKMLMVVLVMMRMEGCHVPRTRQEAGGHGEADLRGRHGETAQEVDVERCRPAPGARHLEVHASSHAAAQEAGDSLDLPISQREQRGQ